MLLNFLVGKSFLLTSVNAVRLDSYCVSSTIFNMPVYCVVANIALSIWEPSLEVLIGLIDDGLKLLEPSQLFGLLSPESLLIFQRLLVFIIVQRICEIVRHWIVKVLVLFFIFSILQGKKAYC